MYKVIQVYCHMDILLDLYTSIYVYRYMLIFSYLEGSAAEAVACKSSRAPQGACAAVSEAG